MSNLNFYKGVTLDDTPVELAVRGTAIESVREIAPATNLPRLLPVLVDLQQNGALGHAYNNLNGEGEKELNVIAGELLRHGVGRVLATLTTAPYDRLRQGVETLNLILESDRLMNALFCGVFHEGVFISPDAGWRGGHDPAYIVPPDFDRFLRLNETSGGRIRMVNVAPELPGALEFIRRVAAAGIRVSLGHCHPDSGTIRRAVESGASMVTHFANGAASKIHRFKNPLWGFLDTDGLSLGLVGDGFHLPPEIVRIAVKTKGIDHCFMVSDANLYSGCAPGRYPRIGGLDCIIESNGFIHVPDREILAGAWFQLDRCVDFLVGTCKMDFVSAWRMCSTIPAGLAGIELPRLQAGDEASFVIYRNGIEKTVFCGKEY